jgi:ABC-type transport system involved in multi-copper enzyme maturation permease subunit
MSVETAAAPIAPAVPSEPAGRERLVRAELRKIFTTNSWWIFGIFILMATALALLINTFQANFLLDQAEQMRLNPPDFSQQMPPGEQLPPGVEEQMREDFARQADVARVLTSAAANIFTSGQFLSLLFIVVLGALVVTNEFFHQTATSTFLTTPQRTRVITSKLIAAVLLAAGFWALTTALSIGVGSLNFATQGYGVPLTDWTVVRSVMMNLLAFVIWAVLGVGLGVLIRSQLGATLTGAALYLISWPVAFILFGTIRTFIIQDDRVFNFVVTLPGVASTIMISTERLQFDADAFGPPWWAGALVLLGYGIVAGVVGTLITRKRDIS